MSLLNHFNATHLAGVLRTSNYWAKYNSNNYPEKIENAINELYEWQDCKCSSDCECKRHGCNKHLVRKANIGFDRYFDHFLMCYVDYKAHDALRNQRTKGRGANSVVATNYIKANWENGFSTALSNKNLLCTEWSAEPFTSLCRKFKPGSDNIYFSKWMALLSLNIYVAYDNGSVSLLNRDYNNPKTYYDLICGIRNDLINHLVRNNRTIADFMFYDNPHEFFPTIPHGTYRPVGNIIDKLYLTL
jgi:hypothetical protein